MCFYALYTGQSAPRSVPKPIQYILNRFRPRDRLERTEFSHYSPVTIVNVSTSTFPLPRTHPLSVENRPICGYALAAMSHFDHKQKLCTIKIFAENHK